MDAKLLTALQRANVKLRLDMVLCLRSYPHVPDASAIHPIRTLGILRLHEDPGHPPRFSVDDPVRENLDEWQRSSRNDFNKIVARLQVVAANEAIENSNVLKRVRHPDAAGLFEVVGKGDHARVFAFYDPGAERLVVCSGTYWKLGRTKNKERESQDAAIIRAAQRMRYWLAGKSVAGYSDWRYLKGESRQ